MGFAQAVLDALPAHLAIVDEKGKIVAVNRSWTRFFDGTTHPAYPVGSNYLAIHADSVARAAKGDKAVPTWITEVLAGARSEFQISFALPSVPLRRPQWILLTGSRFEFRGKVLTVLSHVDITAQVEEQQAQATTVETYVVSRMAAGVCHHVNNGLVPVSGYAELARTMLPDYHPACAYLREVSVAVDHVAAFVARLRPLTTIGASSAPGRTAMRGAILEWRENYKRTIPSNITLSLELGTDELHAQLANYSLFQGLDALVDNAINALDSRIGRIRIALDTVELTEAEAQRHPGVEAGRYVRVVVSDDGPGLTPEHMPQIFHPYYPPHTTRMGTGLAQTALNVRRNGGAIVARSIPDQGTQFEMYFVRAPD